MWTKRQLIEQAYETFGLASYVFDLSPEQMISALKNLDSMMASWGAIGIRLGYLLPSSPDQSDLDQKSGLPDYANEAVYMALAIKRAPTVGKAIARETKVDAKGAYDRMLSKMASEKLVEMQYPRNTPAGAGNKPYRYERGPFLPPPVDPITVSGDGPLTLD
jgi:hypothetical protein